MKVTIDWVLWLLAAIVFAIGALGVNTGKLNMMLLGFTFIALTFVV